MTPTTPTLAPSPVDLATTFCSNISFHRSLYLPVSSEQHERLRVTFATTTNFGMTELPVVLFCHPMGAARYLIFEFEEVAKKEGVRVLIIDRPGFGGSTPVPLDQRVNTWLEIVPAVLEKLGVKHVALMSHSAGTFYAFNTAVMLPQLLYPGKAYMACLAPWTHPSLSSAPLMQVVDKLPFSWVGNFHHIHSFISTYIAPSLAFSSAKMGVRGSLTDEECLRLYGMSRDIWDEVGRLQGQWQGREDVSGISAEASLCCQNPGVDWGVYSSLPSAISLLRTRFQDTLTFKAYFAESDVMIGRGGQRYFEKCWREGNAEGEGNANEEGNAEGEGRVRFEAKIVDGADHDSIVLAEKGVIGDVFREVRRVCG